MLVGPLARAHYEIWMFAANDLAGDISDGISENDVRNTSARHSINARGFERRAAKQSVIATQPQIAQPAERGPLGREQYRIRVGTRIRSVERKIAIDLRKTEPRYIEIKIDRLDFKGRKFDLEHLLRPARFLSQAFVGQAVGLDLGGRQMSDANYQYLRDTEPPRRLNPGHGPRR